uniref:Uncharacterized protein n=1 Tax=Anguilla anguilla TaxID=7936 RepID=A0A0E9W624_ANGAN
MVSSIFLTVLMKQIPTALQPVYQAVQILAIKRVSDMLSTSSTFKHSMFFFLEYTPIVQQYKLFARQFLSLNSPQWGIACCQ